MGADISPSPAFPGLHIVAPPGGGCSAAAVCRCGASRTGRGREQVQQLVAEYARHRDVCQGAAGSPQQQ